MTYVKPTLHIRNANIGGKTVDGKFVFPTDVRIEMKTETEELFQSSGTTAVLAQAVIDLVENNDLDVSEGLRQELSLDIGGGIHVIEIDWTGIDGNDNRWGNTGNGGTKADATGEDLHAQMAVLDHYFQRTTIDSTNPALLEVSEYSSASDAKYDPLKVVPRNPNSVFDATESPSIYDGSVALVETQSLKEAKDAMNTEPV